MWKKSIDENTSNTTMPSSFFYLLSLIIFTLLPNLLSNTFLAAKYCITLKYEIEMMEPLKINFPESTTKRGKYLFSAETFLTVEIYIACFSFIFTSLFVCLMGTAQII